MSAPVEWCSLVYLSAATVSFSSEDLTKLLTKARVTNFQLNISGMLLFKDGYFLQLLEGDRGQVDALYKTIIKDPRHRKAVVLSTAKLSERDFPDWSMGFYDARFQDTEKVPGFSSLLTSSLTIADLYEDCSRAKKILLSFKEGKLLAKGNSAAGSP
jgi:hypothetical protein